MTGGAGLRRPGRAMAIEAEHPLSETVGMPTPRRRGPPASAALAARRGAVILARHGEPALSRKVRLSSGEYRAWWAKYEDGGLREGQKPPELLVRAAREAGVVVASVRRRACDTARMVCLEREFQEDPLWIEAPLPPPRFPSWIKLSPRAWGVVSRFWWWFFDHHEGQETRKQAQARAARAADKIAEAAEQGRDVLVLAHGFFNGMVGVELQRRGWRCVLDQGYRYWSARRFERP